MIKDFKENVRSYASLIGLLVVCTILAFSTASYPTDEYYLDNYQDNHPLVIGIMALVAGLFIYGIYKGDIKPTEGTDLMPYFKKLIGKIGWYKEMQLRYHNEEEDMIE